MKRTVNESATLGAGHVSRNGLSHRHTPLYIQDWSEGSAPFELSKDAFLENIADDLICQRFDNASFFFSYRGRTQVESFLPLPLVPAPEQPDLCLQSSIHPVSVFLLYRRFDRQFGAAFQKEESRLATNPRQRGDVDRQRLP